MNRKPYAVSPFHREQYRLAKTSPLQLPAGGREVHPKSLDAIVRVVKEDHLPNLARFILLIEEDGYREARAVTIDRANGTYEFRSINSAHRGSESSTGVRSLKELMYYPNEVLELCRMMELLDNGDTHFHGCFGYLLISGALNRPEGNGYPEFVRGFAQHLIAKERAAKPRGSNGHPSVDELRQDAWYAQVRKVVDMRMYNNEPPKLEWTIGQADIRWCGGSWNRPPAWKEEESFSIRFDNEGYGLAWPASMFLCGDIWVHPKEKFFELTEGEIAELRKHVLPSFKDTSAVLSEVLNGTSVASAVR